MLPKFFLSGLKGQWEDSGGRIKLGDNTGGGEVKPRHSSSPVYTYNTYYMSHKQNLTSAEFRNVNIA